MPRCWFNPGPAPIHVHHDHNAELVSSSNRKIVETLSELRSKLIVTDVTFKSDPQNFHAHQVVLAASSRPLRCKFSDAVSQRYEKSLTVAPSKRTAMGQILDYFYGLPLVIEKGTALELLELASDFRLDAVVGSACEVLVQAFEPSNAVAICKAAYLRRIHTLLHEANRYIRRHFARVSREADFLGLASVELLGIIDTVELGVDEEVDVYSAVVEWLVEDAVNRRKLLVQHLRKVRCQLLSPRFLELQIESAGIKAAPGCREYLESVLASLASNEPVAVTRRTPFVYLACTEESRLELEVFDVGAGSWEKLKGIGSFGWCVGAGFVEGRLYVAAYDDVANCLNVAVYEPLDDTWQPLTSVTEVTACPGFAVAGSHLYVMGDKADNARAAMRYDVEGRSLEKLPDMSVRRRDFAAVAVGDSLYAIGGYGEGTVLADVECYRPGAEGWTTVAPLEVPRYGAGAAVLDGRIYVAGGCRDGDVLYVVEQYDTRTDTWLFVKRMTVPRLAACLVPVDGKLHAIGGGAEDGVALNTTEVYDPDENEWEQGVEMASRRNKCSAAVAAWQRVEYSMTNDPTNVIRIYGPKIVT